jgi:5'-methylthioadenosine phosphorylase
LGNTAGRLETDDMSKRDRPEGLGIIGGSGVYDIDGLVNTRWEKVASPFGEPSDSLLFGELDGQQLVFLPRHGRGHRIPPSEINFRANIDVLKRAGVTDVVSVSAVGSLREHLRPGTFVIVDQFIDRTFAREKSFFGNGLVAHVSMAHPVCARLGDHLEAAAREANIEMARGGTYLVMEGPQFSSLAESEMYRTWNCDVIGMTNMPEAKLAREAELCYATVAMVTDYDCWHPNHDDVTVEAIVEVLLANADKARALVKRVAPRVQRDSGAAKCNCRSVLEHALITAPEARDPEMVKRLGAVAGRVLKKPEKGIA